MGRRVDGPPGGEPIELRRRGKPFRTNSNIVIALFIDQFLATGIGRYRMSRQGLLGNVAVPQQMENVATGSKILRNLGRAAR
jgi:hypothetical protein